MKAGILAAGMGSRFLRAGWSKPKPLIPVYGKALLSHVLERLSQAGIEEVELLLNEEPLFDMVESYLEQLPEASRVRTWRKTTRSSYESFCFLMDRLGSPPFLLTTVDTIFPEDELKAFLSIRSFPSSCQLVLAVTDFVHDETPLWVKIGKKGEIQNIGESVSTRQFVTAGLYLVLRDLKETARGRPFHALRDFLTELVQNGGDVRAQRFRMALDIDDPEDIQVAESLLRESSGGALA